jgi:hypothetical protein
VGDYTLGQLDAYLGAIQTQEKAHQRLAMIAARAGQASVKGFQKMLKEFD